METVIHILLYAGVGVALFSTLGILVMGDINEKLHYLAPPATLSIGLIATAIVLEEGASQAATKSVLCAVIVWVTNPVLTHVIARAARIREFGHWIVQPDEKRKAG